MKGEIAMQTLDLISEAKELFARQVVEKGRIHKDTKILCALINMNEQLDLIRRAITEYYCDLDNRKHAGIACEKCVNKIETILGMSFERGVTLQD